MAQTSKSHAAAYLKSWSLSLGVPILSVDYSLAPEATFPQPLNEVLYAYCWMRNNFALLGTTGRKVSNTILLKYLIMYFLQWRSRHLASLDYSR